MKIREFDPTVKDEIKFYHQKREKYEKRER